MSDVFKWIFATILLGALITSPTLIAQETAPNVSSADEQPATTATDGPGVPQPDALVQEPSSAGKEPVSTPARPTLAELMREFRSLEKFAMRLRVLEQQSVTFDSEKTQISFGMERVGQLHRVDREFVTRGNHHETTVLEYNIDGQPIGATSKFLKANLEIVAGGKLPMSNAGSLSLHFSDRILNTSRLSELFQQHPDYFALDWANDQAIISLASTDDVVGPKAQVRMQQDGEGRWVPVQYDYRFDKEEFHFHWELQNLDNLAKWYNLDYKPKGYCKIVWGDVRKRETFLRTDFEVQQRTALYPVADSGRNDAGDAETQTERSNVPTIAADEEQLKIFRLQNSDANQTAVVIEQLFGGAILTVAVDARTNSLIVRSNEPLLQQIEAILLRLDEQPGKQASKASSATGSASNSTIAITPDPASTSEPPIVPIAEYRRRLSELELPLLQLAEKVRSVEASLGKEHPESLKQRASLRESIQKTFVARQEIQRAELAEFTRRLQRMQQSLDDRDRIADDIVDRHLEELLNPDVKWDTTSLNAGTVQSVLNVANAKTEELHKTLVSTIRLQDWGPVNDGLRLAVIPTVENSPADEPLEVLLVLKNDSEQQITLKDSGSSADIDTTIRQTSGAQVVTQPLMKSGFSHPMTLVIAPQQAVIVAVQRIRVVESLPENGTGEEQSPADADLLIVDPNAFEFRNVIYTMSCDLNVEVDGDTTPLSLHSGTVAIAFSRPPKEDSSSALAKPFVVPLESSPQESTTGNPELLRKLQGVWTIEKTSSGLIADTSEEQIAKSGEVTIDGRLITIPFTQDEHRADVPMLLELKAPGVPQSINLTIDPNGHAFQALGIIECNGEQLRLCIGPGVANADELNEVNRPKVFAGGVNAVYLECRRRLTAADSAEDVPYIRSGWHPKSVAEKAIGRLVLVFFEDKARRAVPALLIQHGDETIALTAGPATIVPENIEHAIDRSFLEFFDRENVPTTYTDFSTPDLHIEIAKGQLTSFRLENPAAVKTGDILSAILMHGQADFEVTPDAARVTAVEQKTNWQLPSHELDREFIGLIQIDQRFPEGTPLFKDGQLAGITLLGTRFMKDDVPGSYVVPASRIVKVLQQLKTE